MPDLTFTLVISRDNAPALEVELGHESLQALAQATSDAIEQLELLSLLAEHPAAAVRAVAAARDHLSDAAVTRLIADPDPEVRRALFGSASFRRLIATDTLLAMIAADAELAQTVAYDLDAFLEADPVVLARALAEHPDPTVRTAAARTGALARAALRVLANDRDPDVAAAAREGLERG